MTPKQTLVATAAISSYAAGAVQATRILHLLGTGVALGTIAAALIVYSMVTALAEVPTGAIGDRFGRGRVRVVGLVVSATGLALIGFASSLTLVFVGFAAHGFGRAAMSGAAEAWYVDASSPSADDPTYVRALTAAETARSLAVALGAISGVVVVLIHDLVGRDVSSDVLGIVFALAVVAVLIDAVITVFYMREPERLDDMDRSRRELLRPTLANPIIVVVIGVYFTLGLLVAATDLLTPVRLLATNEFRASVIGIGLLTATTTAGAALTAQVAPSLASAARSALRATGLVLLVVAAIGSAAASSRDTATLVVFIAVFVATGPIPVLANTELHQHVGPSQRNTLLSMMSLALMLGGATMSLAVSVFSFDPPTYGVVAAIAVAFSGLSAIWTAGRTDAAGAH